jgi:hypothetical protein
MADVVDVVMVVDIVVGLGGGRGSAVTPVVEGIVGGAAGVWIVVVGGRVSSMRVVAVGVDKRTFDVDKAAGGV